MLQSLFGLQLPLTHNPFNKVRGIFFLKNCVARLYCAVVMFLHTYVLCGYTTQANRFYTSLIKTITVVKYTIKKEVKTDN